MDYEVLHFCETIESVKGIIWIRQDEHDGIRVRVYQGLTGKTVLIDLTDEDITELTGKGYLKSLGLEHLTDALFPSRVIESTTDSHSDPEK